MKRMPSVTPFTRQSLAWGRVLLPRRISIIRSMQSQALMRPSCISFFSRSLARRVLYFRVQISYWNSTEWRMTGTRPRVSGFPSATASILTPKVSSSRVFFMMRFSTASTSAPFLSSMTMRIPSLEDWFEISVISVVSRVSTSFATSFKNFPMPAPIMV